MCNLIDPFIYLIAPGIYFYLFTGLLPYEKFIGLREY